MYSVIICVDICQLFTSPDLILCCIYICICHLLTLVKCVGKTFDQFQVLCNLIIYVYDVFTCWDGVVIDFTIEYSISLVPYLGY